MSPIATPLDTQHHNVTKGPAITAYSRKLLTERLFTTKAEFERYELVIIRPSTFALHMTPKSNSNGRPCGDYRELNNATIPYRYPTPQIRDSSNTCEVKKLSQIPICYGRIATYLCH